MEGNSCSRQMCQKSRRIGCVISRCNLQCRITQPIIRLFWHICTCTKLQVKWNLNFMTNHSMVPLTDNCPSKWRLPTKLDLFCSRNQFFVFRPELRRKLFRLKNLGDVQDTEQNGDESQFKVRSYYQLLCSLYPLTWLLFESVTICGYINDIDCTEPPG